MSELFTRPISARLLRVLAQAAEGYPNQGDMYFVARYTADAGGNFEVIPYSSESEATDGAAALNAATPGAFDVFGPFDTTLPYTSNPDQETVAALQVTTDGGTTFGMDDPKLYDAVFCSAAAVIKFAVPYYTRVYSAQFADTMLQSFVESPLAMMVHLPWSEYAEMEENGTMDVAGTEVPSTEWLPAVVLPDGEGGYTHRLIYPSAPSTSDAALPAA